jgi:hypothetical protein
MALLQTQAFGAFSFSSSGSAIVWNTYTLVFEIKGGGSIDDMAGTFVGSKLEVSKATLVCSNPGTNNRDVRGGVGGITLIIDTPLNDQTTTPIDNRGRFQVTSEEIYAIRDEIPAATVDEQQSIFNAYWMVYSTDCNSEQWDPYAYLIQSVKITGIIYTCSDPNDFNSCVPGDTIILNCATEQDPRYWLAATQVTYSCSATRIKK